MNQNITIVCLENYCSSASREVHWKQIPPITTGKISDTTNVLNYPTANHKTQWEPEAQATLPVSAETTPERR